VPPSLPSLIDKLKNNFLPNSTFLAFGLTEKFAPRLAMLEGFLSAHMHVKIKFTVTKTYDFIGQKFYGYMERN